MSQRMSDLLLVTLLLLGASAGSGEPSEVFRGEDLAELARQIRDFTPKDDFDAPPDLPSVEGAGFAYVVTPRKRGPNHEICSGFPSWGYSIETKKLEVSFGKSSLSGFDLWKKTGGFAFSDFTNPRHIKFRTFSCTLTRLPNYEAQNAFGATATVSKEHELVTSIADFEDIRNLDTSNWWSTALPGDEARDISSHLQVRVSGTLADWESGRPVVCGVRRNAPKMDWPYDKQLDICLFRGKATLIEIIDGRSGDVLHAKPL